MSRELIVHVSTSRHVVLGLIWPVLVYKKGFKGTLNNHWVVTDVMWRFLVLWTIPFPQKHILDFQTAFAHLTSTITLILLLWSVQETLESSKTSTRNDFHRGEISQAQLHGLVCLKNSVHGHEQNSNNVHLIMFQLSQSGGQNQHGISFPPSGKLIYKLQVLKW